MSIWISGGRSSSSEVSNQSLDRVAIDIDNIWRNRQCAKVIDTGMGLRENYTQVKIALTTQMQHFQVLQGCGCQLNAP